MRGLFGEVLVGDCGGGEPKSSSDNSFYKLLNPGLAPLLLATLQFIIII